jgi:hypothetical protein
MGAARGGYDAEVEYRFRKKIGKFFPLTYPGYAL